MRQQAKVLAEVATRARVFVSMPVVPGITPRPLCDPSSSASQPNSPVERRHGVFALDEVGLPCLDHVALYGDGCFEGILIPSGRIFLLKEHIERLWASTRRLDIEIPYTPAELVEHILETSRQVKFGKSDNGYIRLVVTRGLGDLGINPRKCVAPTLFSLTSTIRLYPREMYETGIEVGLARQIRRPHASVLDARIKSNNYLNNVLALLEGTRSTGTLEALMLTRDGFIAEATVDNIFLIHRHPGWEDNPNRVEVLTPRREYCLNGITRALILKFAREAGYRINQEADMLPVDLIGADNECFMTGTGAGVMPIIKVMGKPIGEGRPGPITRKLVEQTRAAMASPEYGLPLTASAAEIEAYLEGPGMLPEESVLYRSEQPNSVTSSPEYA
jgi:branched-chain amino acid aminotransferase